MKADLVLTWLDGAARDGRPYHSPAEAATAIRELIAERNALQRTFDMMWAAQSRAIAAWQERHDKPMTWPDHARLVDWLLEDRERLRAALQGLLRHPGIADMDPEDKDPEDHAAERAARSALEGNL